MRRQLTSDQLALFTFSERHLLRVFYARREARDRPADRGSGSSPLDTGLPSRRLCKGSTAKRPSGAILTGSAPDECVPCDGHSRGRRARAHRVGDIDCVPADAWEWRRTFPAERSQRAASGEDRHGSRTPRARSPYGGLQGRTGRARRSLAGGTQRLRPTGTRQRSNRSPGEIPVRGTRARVVRWATAHPYRRPPSQPTRSFGPIRRAARFEDGPHHARAHAAAVAHGRMVARIGGVRARAGGQPLNASAARHRVTRTPGQQRG